MVRHTLGVICVAVASSLFVTHPALASVVEPLSVTQLSQQADRIILGRVLDVAPRWSDDGSIIVTTVQVQTTHVFKGERRVVDSFEIVGGTIDGLTLRRTDTPMFESGDGVFVFLNSADELVGSYQGAFYTDGSVVTRCEPAAHSVDDTFMTPLRDMADGVTAALNVPSTDEEDLRLDGTVLPNNGRFEVYGADWSYMSRPMGETYVINPTHNDPALGGNEVLAIVGVFFGGLGWWDGVFANFKFFIDTQFSTATAAALDGENSVFFCQSGTCGMDAVTVATTYLWSEGANLVEWDMVFNDVNFRFWTDINCYVPGETCEVPGGHYDLPSVAAHEFGHALGLAHSNVPDATMWPGTVRLQSRDASTPEQDDIDGVVFLYGAIVPESYEFRGQFDGDRLGWSIACAGDVNRDGWTDMIASAPFSHGEHSRRGTVYLYSGRTGFLLNVIEGEERHDRFGVSLAKGGDINRDGYDDFIVGSPYANRLQGVVEVFSGKTGEVLHVWGGRQLKSDRFGWSIAGNVDVDGDNWKDVIVGAPWEDRDGIYINVGAVHVYSGRTGQRIARFFGEKQEDRFGWSVAGVGRLNSDDHDEFVVGAPLNDDAGRNAGKVYAYSGRHLRTFYTMTGPQRNAQFGHALVGVAKVDPDGKDGFAVSAPYYDRGEQEQAGRVDLYSGRYGHRIYSKKGEGSGDRLGWSIAAAGDLDLDGIGDLTLGAPRHSSAGFKAGRVYIRSGRTGNVLYQRDGEADGDQFGFAVGAVTDLDDDGLPEMVATAPYEDTRGSKSGRVYVDFSDERIETRRTGTDESTHPSMAPADSEVYSPQAQLRSRLKRLLRAWVEGAMLADVDGDDVVTDADLDLILRDG